MIIRRDAHEFVSLPGRESADPFAQAPQPDFSMRVVRVEGATRRSPHRHPDSAEVIYVVRGRGRIWEDGHFRAVEAGDCILIPAGVAHATIPEADGSMEVVCFFPRPDLAANIEEISDVVIVDGTREGKSE